MVVVVGVDVVVEVDGVALTVEKPQPCFAKCRSRGLVIAVCVGGGGGRRVVVVDVVVELFVALVVVVDDVVEEVVDVVFAAEG